MLVKLVTLGGTLYAREKNERIHKCLTFHILTHVCHLTVCFFRQHVRNANGDIVYYFIEDILILSTILSIQIDFEVQNG